MAFRAIQSSNAGFHYYSVVTPEPKLQLSLDKIKHISGYDHIDPISTKAKQ